MRILFVCSGLEPGRDGVGDYARRLAEECVRAGHACGLLAVHDRFIDAAPGAIEENDGEIPVLRLSPQMSWKERTERSVAFRTHFNPDWISLQFVPYGFHDRGLVSHLAPELRTILGASPVHLMFHELWIGAAQGVTWKARFTGLLQRRALRQLLGQIKPRLVTTSVPAYVTMLEPLAVRAVLLPLFGNIPFIPASLPLTLPPQVQAAGIGASPETRADWWMGLFFGALHAEWKPEPLFQILLEAAAQAGKKICLIQAGRMGTAGDRLWRQIKKDYAGRIIFVALDEQPAEQISLLFQGADFGIAASPWQLIGKSSSVASMLDHGLPVIVTRDDYHLRGLPAPPLLNDPLLHRCDEALKDKLVEGLPRRMPQPRLAATAERLIGLLREASETSGSQVHHPEYAA